MCQCINVYPGCKLTLLVFHIALILLQLCVSSRVDELLILGITTRLGEGKP